MDMDKDMDELGNKSDYGGTSTTGSCSCSDYQYDKETGQPTNKEQCRYFRFCIVSSQSDATEVYGDRLIPFGGGSELVMICCLKSSNFIFFVVRENPFFPKYTICCFVITGLVNHEDHTYVEFLFCPLGDIYVQELGSLYVCFLTWMSTYVNTFM
jgi:hypothetical protein